MKVRLKLLIFEAPSSKFKFKSHPNFIYLPSFSFRFLMGEVAGAKADLLESVKISPSSTYSLVKIASVHMEEGDPEKAFECFEEAIKHNPNDPDIYYHRGQGLYFRVLSSESAQV